MERTPDELRAQSPHVLWSLRQMVAMATHLGRRHDAGVSIMQDAMDAAALEAFCVYARALIEFLWRDRRSRRGRPRKTDAVAGDWFPGGVWREDPELPEELVGVADRTGWGVAHISYTRQREHTYWNHEDITHRIAYRFACFVADVDPELVEPRFRETAEAAIIEWRGTLPFSVIPTGPRLSATPGFAIAAITVPPLQS
jgi:hypothetical protein